MNNIEILEERINFCKNNTECREELKQCFGCTFEIEEIEAIENLIQENKELKEYKKIAELTKQLETEKEKNKELENCLQMAKQIMTADISEDFDCMKLKEFKEYLLNEIKLNENFEE